MTVFIWKKDALKNASIASCVSVPSLPLIYTPFGGLQSRGAGLARLAGGFSSNRDARRF